VPRIEDDGPFASPLEPSYGCSTCGAMIRAGFECPNHPAEAKEAALRGEDIHATALALLTLLDATPSTRPVAVLSQSGEAARLREALGMPEKPGCRCPACVREP
jgi:hypothetical protein